MTEERTSILFRLEDDSKLLDHQTSDGIPVWMIARWYLLYSVVGGKLYGYQTPVRNRKISSGMVKNLCGTMVHNTKELKKIGRSRVVLYTTNRETLIDGRYYNRYVDPFYEVYPKESFVIEQAMLNWKWPYPRVNQEVAFDTLSRITGEVLGRLNYKKEYSVVHTMLEYFNRRLKEIADISLTAEEMNAAAVVISRQIVALRYQSVWLERQLSDHVKVLIMVGAGFSFNYAINRMLKHKGIVSVELQHGYVNSENIMYNYAPSLLRDDRVRAGLPDYMITYGQWWSDQMNCPMKKVEIGNPYHDMCLAGIDKAASRREKNILIIGIGTNTEGYLAFADQIAGLLPEYKVRFRPHPGERVHAEELKGVSASRVEMDETVEVYDSLAWSSIVIGEVSTVLYEAIGIVDRIFVWDTEYSAAYLPEHPFEHFSRAGELPQLLKNQTGNAAIDYDSFWKRNWKQNYRRFLRSVLVQDGDRR